MLVSATKSLGSIRKSIRPAAPIHFSLRGRVFHGTSRRAGLTKPSDRRRKVATIVPQAALVAPLPAPQAEPLYPNVEEATVDLPTLSKESAKKVLSARGLGPSGLPEEVYGCDRAENALLMYPKSAKTGSNEVPVVIFAHGFSQPPENYRKTLLAAASAGSLVIAPKTSTFDVAKPWDKVPGAGKNAAAPTKLQAALITDILRSALYLRENWTGAPLGNITLVGHSMGSGASLVASSYLDKVAGVCIAAPAVAGLIESPINPKMHMAGGAKRREDLEEAEEFFANYFPDTASLHIIGADQDQIVKPLEVALLFAAAKKAKDKGLLKDVTLFQMEGSHVGFEDRVNIELDNKLLAALFNVVNYLLYGKEILRFALKDPSQQRERYELLVIDAVREFNGKAPVHKFAEDVVRCKSGVDDLSTPEREGLELIALQPVPMQQDWLPATAAVLAYASGHAFTVFNVGKLVVPDLLGGASLSSELSMLAVGLIAGSLVYDNSLLAAGRFIGEGPVLQALSSTRFLAHSAAPLLVLVGSSLAARAGVEWAEGGLYTGVVTAAVAGAIGLSAFRNYFLLETRAISQSGIVRYTYDDVEVDLSRLVPVSATSLLLTVAGISAWRADPQMGVLAAGPLVSTLLQVVPGKRVPQFILGNLGEVVLLASLVAAETTLRSQGL